MDNLLKPVDLNTYRPIRDVVFEELREAIFSGKLKPKQRLIETVIAEQMGVSRTPVREAIRMLQNEGLVVHVPRKGVLVSGFSKEDIIEIYRIRSVLEGLAASLAAKNITEDEISELDEILENVWRFMNENKISELSELYNKLNFVLTRASRSPRLCALIDTMQEYIEQTRVVSFSSKERQICAYKEHKDIVGAVRKRDRELAERLVREHIRGARKAFEKNLKDSSSKTDYSLGATRSKE